MHRAALLTAIGAVALVGGTALAAASGREDRPVPLVAAGAPTSVDRTTPSTTETPSTTTTAAPAPSTTSTTAAPRRTAGPLHLRCAGGGTTSGGDAWIACEVKDVDDGAAFLTLTRDGETIARTDDTSATAFKDREVRPGATHSYQAHSYTADGRPLQRSEAVRATAGGGYTYDGPLVLRCSGDGSKSGATPDSATIACQWKGVPERASYVVLTRDGQPIARTDDGRVTSHEDRDVRPGQTYAYEVHAHAADGTVLESSGAVRATAAGEHAEGALVMRCASDGSKDGTKPYTPAIHCEWKGVPERAAELVLFRDGEPFASTDDTTITGYDDREVTPGTTYTYQLHAYAADGALLDSSDPVRATPGGTGDGA